MDLELKGKVAVVTGGSKGIGHAVARAYLAEGASVAIIARGQAGLDAAVSELAPLAQHGARIVAIAADLTDAAQAERAVAQAEAELGPIDILVNSAGAARRYDPDTLDAEKWQAAMNAKFFPYVYTQDAVLKRMRTRQRGSVVNIIGNGGKQPSVTHVAGGSANAALMLSTLGLAQHYAKQGIRINAINPGSTYTGRVDQALDVDSKRLGVSKEQVLQDSQSRIPLGRYGKPEEVADVALFLSSARASYVVGVIVPMTGGMTPTV
ncbi:SDR family oxidoreductase [Achromobacter aloeverae]|uniref:3-oxoacyl-ACP reductase n=1 Tax=Achromobacter aloeverae TaxID=1750518 RepID=A0A4Q1HLW7_9BURK|nr:SDR family oxidoreductase [Achromobacter aloeverae]RXN91457.1 3-oxoacyl-ACP reductase [Achromobacter aloeverae]